MAKRGSALSTGMMRRRRFSKLLPFLYVFLTTPAEAQTSEEQPQSRLVRLLLPVCSSLPFDESELLSILSVELRAYGIALADGTNDETSADVVLAVLDIPGCGSDHVQVRIESLTTEESSRRRIEISDIPADERSRVLALAIAEFLESTWLSLTTPETLPELETADEADAVPSERSSGQIDDPEIPFESSSQAEDSATEVESQAEGQNQRRPFHLLMSLEILLFPQYRGSLFGGQLGFSAPLLRSIPLRLQVNGRWAMGDATTPLGKIRSQATTGSLSLFYFGGSERIKVFVGPRVEVGWGWAESRPNSEERASTGINGIVLSTLVSSGLHAMLGSRLAVLIDLSLGYTIIGLAPSAGELNAGGIAGPVFTSNIGLVVLL